MNKPCVCMLKLIYSKSTVDHFSHDQKRASSANYMDPSGLFIFLKQSQSSHTHKVTKFKLTGLVSIL